MLRVAFHSSSERNFQTVLRGLSTLSERIGQNVRSGFIIYNVSAVKSGREAALGVEMVEIHNDADNVYNSALDQVISSIQRMPVIDDELLRQSSSAGHSRESAQYCMMPGRLFAAVPATLGFVVRQATGKHSAGPPAVIRFETSCSNVTSVLDLLNQMADLALKSPGMLACLVQGIDRYSNDATLLFVFAGDVEVLAFAQDQQARLLAKSACKAAGRLDVSLEGKVSGFAERATLDFIKDVKS